MTSLAAGSLALTLASLVFLFGGFVVCGVLWWLMVVRPRDDDAPRRRKERK